MKMYLISDNIDTLTGMRLAGVEGVVVHEMQEVKEALDKVLADKEIGIVLLTEKFGRDFPDLINRVRLEHNFSSFCGNSPTVTHRPQAGLYHRLCERGNRPQAITEIPL